jgi:hypothetical protein
MPLRGGARKAMAAMKKRYGAKKGKRIFYAKANKYGKRGKSPDQKARSVYKKGGRLRKRRGRRK